MNKIETSRLIIRNFRADEWQELQDIIIRYQTTEYAKYDHKWPTSAEEIQDITAWFANGDNYLAVCLKPTGQLIGFIAINRREEQDGKVYNLGYIFHIDYQGKGYATESCQSSIGYVFGCLGADRILTGTHPDNIPSIRLLKKLGLKKIKPGEFTISRKEWLAPESPERRIKHA